jgi:hypothetical protein
VNEFAATYTRQNRTPAEDAGEGSTEGRLIDPECVKQIERGAPVLGYYRPHRTGHYGQGPQVPARATTEGVMCQVAEVVATRSGVAEAEDVHLVVLSQAARQGLQHGDGPVIGVATEAGDNERDLH